MVVMENDARVSRANTIKYIKSKKGAPISVENMMEGATDFIMPQFVGKSSHLNTTTSQEPAPMLIKAFSHDDRQHDGDAPPTTSGTRRQITLRDLDKSCQIAE